MDEKEEFELSHNRMVLWHTELAESCDEISKLCRECLEILNNPIKMVFEYEKLEKNINIIGLKFASLCQLGELLTKSEEE